MRTVLLVPRRDGDRFRDEVWAWCKARWQRLMPDLDVVEGHHEGGYFNRSAAVNRAAANAGAWDVAVIIDSDIIIDPEQVRRGIEAAVATGSLVRPFAIRHELNQRGSRRIMAADYGGNWRPYVQRVYTDMLSSCIVVTRALWDQVGGFDEAFVGWGFEDNAFHAACVTFGGPMVEQPGDLWHLWHPRAVEGRRGSATVEANRARARRYTAAIGDKAAIMALRDKPMENGHASGIPRILHRVVPEHTLPQAEAWWQAFQQMHQGWTFMTHRDPLVPKQWPLTSPHWERCESGAQLADLVRLEALLRWGGVYVDQDVEPYRPLTPLLHLPGFAAWEDPRAVPNAVLGATPGHPAIEACLELAIERLDQGTWKAGVGVTTEVLPGRDDFLVLPPGAFYPYHYSEKEQRRRENHRKAQPWAFVAHHWWASWLPA